MRERPFLGRYEQPAGLGGGSLRRPAREVRHADLHRQRRKQFLHRMPRCGPLRRDFEGFLLRKSRRLPPRAGRRLDRHPSRGPEPRRRREEGSRQLRLRLLPDLSREQLRRRRVAEIMLPLPRGERAASGATLARSHVHPHKCERGKRAGLRAVPLPGVPEQPREPPGHARRGGNAARVLQQHAVPRRHGRTPRRWDRLARSQPAVPRRDREAGYIVLPGVPRYAGHDPVQRRDRADLLPDLQLSPAVQGASDPLVPGVPAVPRLCGFPP